MTTLAAIFLDKYSDFRRGLSTDSQPVIDSFAFQAYPRVGFGNHRIIRSKFFDHTTISRSTRINRTNSKKRTMFTSHLFHANFYCHFLSFRFLGQPILFLISNRAFYGQIPVFVTPIRTICLSFSSVFLSTTLPVAFAFLLVL